MAGGYFVTGFGSPYWGGHREPSGWFLLRPRKNRSWEEDVQHLKALFTSLAWWRLDPHDELLGGSAAEACRRHKHPLVVKQSDIVPPAKACWCLAEPGQCYLVYVRGTREPLKLNPATAGPVRLEVREFDPRTGAYRWLASYQGTGPVTLTPPHGEDTVFVLRAPLHAKEA